jgi:ribonuclease HII
MIRDTALAAQIGYASAQEIDRLNILNASLLSMQRAILKLNPVPQLCLIDGNRQVPHLTIAQQTLLEGEQHSLAIAAASILAKVWRDELISRLDTQYPGYDLVHNKGYGTSKHRQGLHQYGSSPLHRRSFQPVALYARTMGR